MPASIIPTKDFERVTFRDLSVGDTLLTWGNAQVTVVKVEPLIQKQTDGHGVKGEPSKNLFLLTVDGVPSGDKILDGYCTREHYAGTAYRLIK